MEELDWVEIKAGEFRPGFTEAQKQKIREYAYAKVDFKSWKPKEYALFEEFVTKYRQYWDKSSPPIPYPHDLDKALMPLKNDKLQGLFTVERELARVETTGQAVKMERFYITRYPVTVKQFTLFFKTIKDKLTRRELHKLRFNENLIDLTKGRIMPAGINNSVIANQFCEQVGGRLPTLFEWEYAARGPDGLLYPWGNKWKPQCGHFAPYLAGEHQKGNKKGHIITPVDAYPAGVSPFGVWDMIGNMQEQVDGQANNRLIDNYKGPSPREVYEPVWFHYLPGLAGEVEILPGYTGFRVVKEKWGAQTWSGFNGEIEVAENNR